jgi:hypothetical protein
MRASSGINELGGDANAFSTLAYGTFEHVAHAQFAADLLHIDRSTFVRERGVARDDEQSANATERGDDFFDHAVGEIFLLRVARHVLERQNRDRWLLGKR